MKIHKHAKETINKETGFTIRITHKFIRWILVFWFAVVSITIHGCKRKADCKLYPCIMVVKKYANEICELEDAECEELKSQAKSFLHLEDQKDCSKEKNKECHRLCIKIHFKRGIDKRCIGWDQTCERIRENKEK